MKEFESIIHQLNADPLAAVTVEYKDSFGAWGALVRNASAKSLEAKYGSVVNFFEDVYAKNLKHLRISPRRQNGSYKGSPNFRAAGDPIEVILGDQTVNQESSKPPVQNPMPTIENHAIPALQSPAMPGMAGAGLTGDAAYRYYDYTRLLNENNRLVTENERLKKEHDEFKDQLRENKFSSDKSKQTTEIISTLAPLLAPAIISRFAPGAGGAAVPGLGQPDPTLSPIKQQFISAITQSDDGTVEYLFQVAQLIANDDFDQRLSDLIAQFNQKQAS